MNSNFSNFEQSKQLKYYPFFHFFLLKSYFDVIFLQSIKFQVNIGTLRGPKVQRIHFSLWTLFFGCSNITPDFACSQLLFGIRFLLKTKSTWETILIVNLCQLFYGRTFIRKKSLALQKKYVNFTHIGTVKKKHAHNQKIWN